MEVTILLWTTSMWGAACLIVISCIHSVYGGKPDVSTDKYSLLQGAPDNPGPNKQASFGGTFPHHQAA